MALDPEVSCVVLLDGPAFLDDSSQWPSQNACLEMTKQAVGKLVSEGVMRPVDIEAAARLLSGAALNAAPWVAASDEPQSILPKAVEAFRLMATGFLAAPGGTGSEAQDLLLAFRGHRPPHPGRPGPPALPDHALGLRLTSVGVSLVAPQSI
jgi:hypothetical protein